MNLHDGTMVTDSEMIKDFDELAPLGGISYFKDEVIQVIPNDVQIKDEIFDMDSIKAPSSTYNQKTHSQRFKHILKDIINLHPVLDKTTYHLVNKERLAKMKKEAILINCSRGPVIDEAALVEHLKQNPMFRVGLDVFEEEPYMKSRLTELKNAIVVPHIASASNGKIKGYPVWFDANRVEAFLKENARPPATCPSIVNAKALGEVVEENKRSDSCEGK
ncbi:hypothetical protein JHK85_028597 [Glycine max]|nr:hypothetical protein JHK85_028597 [Glycine max]KAG5003921.1 hypothetical protein JHK86_028060 [Glycine max]